MAKSTEKKPKTKTAIPTINKPSSGMMAWLNQQTVAPESDVPETQAHEVTPLENPEEILPPAQQPARVDQPDEPVNQAPEALAESEEVDDSDRGGEDTSQQSSPSIEEPASLPRKPKAKSGGTNKAGKYADVFFKKTVKAADDFAGEVKPIRISEESHWLLSVLVEQARRAGYKVNVSDLIDNLLTNHRETFKTDVDELINQWKVRKRI